MSEVSIACYVESCKDVPELCIPKAMAAIYLGVSRSWVDKLIQKGELGLVEFLGENEEPTSFKEVKASTVVDYKRRRDLLLPNNEDMDINDSYQVRSFFKKRGKAVVAPSVRSFETISDQRYLRRLRSRVSCVGLIVKLGPHYAHVAINYSGQHREVLAFFLQDLTWIINQ